MKISILDDGVTHLNIYSKGHTELGRKLSNFYRYPLKLDDQVYYSIEAYWYCLRIKQVLNEGYVAPPDHTTLPTWVSHLDALSKLSGWQAKSYGREVLSWLPPSNLHEAPEEFREAIRKAIRIKIETIPNLREGLVATGDIPILHYYWYGNNPNNVSIVTPKDVKWINDWITELRTEYQQN